MIPKWKQFDKSQELPRNRFGKGVWCWHETEEQRFIKTTSWPDKALVAWLKHIIMDKNSKMKCLCNVLWNIWGYFSNIYYVFLNMF